MPRAKQGDRQDIKTVAKAAKVSIATVSRVINRKSSVSPETAERVWKAIKKLNFHPNHGARAMVSGRSHTIGLIVSRITNPFFPELIEGFEQEAAKAGYEILLGSLGKDGSLLAGSVQRMLERNAEGVAVMTHGMSAAELGDFAIFGTPLVFIDAAPAPGLGSVVQVDYEGGLRQAVQHLAVLGHREIAFISGSLQRYSARLRQQAFVQAMAAIGVHTPVCVEGDHTPTGGHRAMQSLLANEGARPTAIICSNDMTTLGVLQVAADAGISVPDDLSLVGFDNIQLAQFASPPLTTVGVDRGELARLAFESLLERLEKPEQPQLSTVFAPTQLVVRRSTTYAPERKAMRRR